MNERDLMDLVKEHRENDRNSFCWRCGKLKDKTDPGGKLCGNCAQDVDWANRQDVDYAALDDEIYQRSKDDQAVNDLVGF